jgi:hypothetical protein
MFLSTNVVIPKIFRNKQLHVSHLNEMLLGSSYTYYLLMNSAVS